MFQQIIVKFKSLVPQIKVYRARKHKSDIVIHMNIMLLFITER